MSQYLSSFPYSLDAVVRDKHKGHLTHELLAGAAAVEVMSSSTKIAPFNNVRNPGREKVVGTSGERW